MAHFGTLKDYQFAQEVGDIRGAELYGANDEKLGKIDDVIFDHSSGTLRYAVVDTGGWLHSKRFLVPANQIFARPKHEDDFAVNLTKQQIEHFPPYDEKSIDRPEEFRDYEKRYRTTFGEGPVLHRTGSNHIITPEAAEMPEATGNFEEGEGFNFTPNRIADKFADPTPDPNRLRMRPAGLAAKAEDERLPGSDVAEDKPTFVEEHAADKQAEKPATGKERDTIFGLYENAPVDAQSAEQDSLTNPDDLYVPAAERHKRITGFQELLQRNRVDITARCGSCGEKKAA